MWYMNQSFKQMYVSNLDYLENQRTTAKILGLKFRVCGNNSVPYKQF